MPAFPDVYQDHLDLAMPQQRLTAEASPADFGAASAGALGEVAKGLGEVSRAAYTANDHLNEANATEMDNEYVKFERQRKADFYSKQGRNALEDRQPLETDLNAKIADISKNWGRSDAAREAFAKVVNNRLNDTLTSADSYNQKQLTKYQNDTSTARMDQAGQNVAGSFHDPKAVAKNIGVIDQESDAIGQREGWSQETLDDYKRQQRAQAYIGGFQVAVSADPYGVKKQLNDPKGYGADLDPDKKAALLRMADAEIERRQAKAESNLRQVAENQVKLAGLGVPVDPSQRLNVNTIRSVLGDGYAAEYELKMASADAQQSLFAKPRSELLAIANAPDVVPKGPEDVIQMQYVKGVKQGAKDILKQMDEDPAAYLINRGLMDDAPHALAAQGRTLIGAAQSNDWATAGTILLSRKAAIEGTGAKLGFSSANPLTKDEASAFGEALRKLPPDKQADILGGIAKNMGPGNVYKAFTRQIGDTASKNTGYAGYIAQYQDRSVGSVGAPKASQYILRGQSLLNPVGDDGKPVKSTFKMPEESGHNGLDAFWNNYIGATGKDSGGSGVVKSAYLNSPAMEAGTKEAFRAAYAGLAEEHGYTDGALNTKLATQAAQIATGGVEELWGNTKTVMPWGMTGTQFQKIVTNNWDRVSKGTDLEGTHPSNWSFVIAGDGRYRVMSGNRVARWKNGADLRLRIGAPDASMPTPRSQDYALPAGGLQ